MQKSKLILVGAGPGDPDLITIKGAKMLAKADVILYDTLSHPDLLEYASPEAEQIYVGKKPGSCRNGQDEINKLIVEKALQDKCVVRLKGGDPFVFGRGHEEVEYAREHGIPVEIVPGISSCTSVGALQVIPLTKRGISESFWVTTGVTRHGNVSKDIMEAARSDATIAILMGMRKLPQIALIFKKMGRAHTPAAVIQQGSLPEEIISLGTIETIVAEVDKKRMTNPALILIGEVVRLHPQFRNEAGHKKNSAGIVRRSYREIAEYFKVGLSALSF